jgi:hypothetical protein
MEQVTEMSQGVDINKFSRDDYIRGNCNHSEYYGQFVTEAVTRTVLARFGLYSLSEAYKNDKSFNDISLVKWDRLPNLVLEIKNDVRVSCLASTVCVYKEAARRLVAEHIEKQRLAEIVKSVKKVEEK